MKLVLDASVAVAAARPNEPSHAASRARVERVLAGQDELLVPAIFPIEVGASLARVGEPREAVCDYVDCKICALPEYVVNSARNGRKLQRCRTPCRAPMC